MVLVLVLVVVLPLALLLLLLRPLLAGLLPSARVPAEVLVAVAVAVVVIRRPRLLLPRMVSLHRAVITLSFRGARTALRARLGWLWI